MNKIIILLWPWLLLSHCLKAQELVVDPATSAAVAIDAATINGKLNTTNKNLTLIGEGQLAVTGQLTIVNTLQNKIYKGLSQVASIISNLQSIKDIAECGSDIVGDVGKAINYAKSDPVLLLFAEQGARDFEARSVTLAANVAAFVLKGGSSNLMDSGERAKLLNHIVSELRVLRGIAYGMYRAMYWANMNGIFRTLNPWATWQNQDIRIASDVLAHAKYLKQ